MKFLILILLVCVGLSEPGDDFTELQEPGHCLRKGNCDTWITPHRRVLHCHSNRVCRDDDTGGGKFHEFLKRHLNPTFQTLHFVISVGYLNFVGVGAGAWNRDSAQFDGFGAKYVFHKLVEYKTVGGGAYDPETSTVCREWMLVHRPDVQNTTFDGLRYTNRTGHDFRNDEMREWRTMIRNPPQGMPDIEVFYVISDKEVLDDRYPEGRKPVVTPDALKINLNITRIQYHCGDSTGLALHGLVITKKFDGDKLRRRVGQENEEPDREYPDESSDTQVVLDIDDENGDSQGCMGFKKEFFDETGTKQEAFVGEVEKDIDVFWKHCTEDWCTRIENNLKFGADYEVSGIWLSFPGKPTKIFYDPSVGMDTGASSMIVFSVVLLFSLLFLLL